MTDDLDPPPQLEPPADPGDPRPSSLTARARGVARGFVVDLSPFRASRDYRRLWWGQVISATGHQITVVAVFVQVYDLTGSAAKVGLVGLFQFIATMIAGLFGGPLIDRLDRRKLLLGTEMGLVVTSASLWQLSRADRPSLWLIYLVVSVGAALGTIASPTRGSIIPNLISRDLMPAAVALNQVMWNTAQIAGPAVGGVLIAKVGVTWAYGIDVVSYAGAIVATLLLPSQIPQHDGAGPATGLRAITEALGFVRRERVLQATFVVDLIAMIFGMPRALFPILAVTQFHRGPEVVGALFSAIAVGAFVGALSAGWVGRVRRQGLAVLVAVAVWGACIALFGLTTWLPLALLLLAMAGMADVISAVFRGTILQATVTDAVRGRLTAMHILVVTGGPRLGDLESGLVAAAFSPAVSVVSGGVACIVGVALMAVAYPAFTAYRAVLEEDGDGD